MRPEKNDLVGFIVNNNPNKRIIHLCKLDINKLIAGLLGVD